MSTQSNAFNKLYITDPGTPAASPDPYVEIGNIFSLGDIGVMFNKIATSSLSDGVDRDLKGTKQTSTFTVVMNYDAEDAGQADLKDAGEDSTNALYNLKLKYNDADGGEPSTWTFKAKVNGFKHIGGGANDVKKATSEIMVEMDTLEFEEAA